MRYLMVILAAFCFLGASRCANMVRPDSSALAAEMNDATVMIEGCGNQPIVGYTYCRVTEGQSTEGNNLILLSPPTVCKSEPCVVFNIYMPQGQDDFSVSVPMGQTRTMLPWGKILNRPTFEKGDRGFWGIVMKWKWLDLEGKEYESIAEGEIRMRVLSRDYERLDNGDENSAFVWKWRDLSFNYRMTTAGRAAIWRR